MPPCLVRAVLFSEGYSFCCESFLVVGVIRFSGGHSFWWETFLSLVKVVLFSHSFFLVIFCRFHVLKCLLIEIINSYIYILKYSMRKHFPWRQIPTFRLHWHFTCGSDFRYSLILPFAVGTMSHDWLPLKGINISSKTGLKY